jgi:prepilin peptidase CpaA
MPSSVWVPWVPAVPLVAAAAWDLRTGEIPDAFPLLLVAWAVVARLFGWLPVGWERLPAEWLDPVLGGVAGFALGFALFSAGVLGGGDGKVLAGLGAVVGLRGLALVFVLTCLFGGLLAVAARTRQRKDVRYGPAIALGYVGAVVLAKMS